MNRRPFFVRLGAITGRAGPTWEGLDGGKVVGEVQTSMPVPVDRPFLGFCSMPNRTRDRARSPR